MPLLDRMRALFARKGENEKKITFLSERRASLNQQRDRAYEEIGHLEQKDDQLQKEFKDVTSPVTRRRITSQLVQLRKDIERRQQLLQVLNQQINVVSTHLHNLELVQQGQSSRLPDSEEPEFVMTRPFVPSSSDRVYSIATRFPFSIISRTSSASFLP